MEMVFLVCVVLFILVEYIFPLVVVAVMMILDKIIE